MLCDRCKSRNANMRKIQVVNYQKKEINLCNECAIELGYLGNNLGSLFSALLNTDSIYSGVGAYDKKCNVCGSSINTINKTGKFGCSECYTTFIEEIRPLLRKIHGNCMHKGASPYTITPNLGDREENLSDEGNKQMEVQKLKQEMHQAVEKEEFEKAAMLRDKIKMLEEGE